ncbi:hypothetical protein DRO54_07310 [Candidatus Bathyarchaeota archaeon]|nr:MAG: hypothetical protein DRO54_07310 [Candidatus Bathyarchaeota archaeon]
MKVSRVSVRRIYNLRQYESLHVEFSVELEEGENPSAIVLKLHQEIWEMEKTIGLFEEAKNKYDELIDLVEGQRYRSRYSEYVDLFHEYKEKTKKILDEKLKTLGCLEKIDMTNIEALTACMEEYNIKTLQDLVGRKEKIKEQIKEIEEHLKRIEKTEIIYREFKKKFDMDIEATSKLFERQEYSRAREMLERIIEKTEEMHKMIKECNPEKYKYSWQ